MSENANNNGDGSLSDVLSAIHAEEEEWDKEETIVEGFKKDAFLRWLSTDVNGRTTSLVGICALVGALAKLLVTFSVLANNSPLKDAIQFVPTFCNALVCARFVY